MPPQLLALEAEAAITPVQRCLNTWVAAGRRSDVFRQLLVTGLQVEQRVTEVLKRSGPIGEDHGALLRLMALSLTSGLLDEQAMHECHAVCPAQEWLDAVPRRVAWSVAVGGGKTLTAASLCRAVADQVAADPALTGPLSRGVLYSCRTHKLIEGMLQALEVMGVPRDLVGVFHGTDGAAVPSIRRQDIGKFPILLTTQAQLQNGSARHDRPWTGRKDEGLDLEELLLYAGRDRLTIWDEAFQSSLADSASTKRLSMGLGSLRQTVSELGDGEVLWLKSKRDKGRVVTADALNRGDGEQLVQLLEQIVAGAHAAVVGALKQPIEPIRLPVVTERQVMQLKGVAKWMRYQKSRGPAEAIEAVAAMSAAGALQVSLLKGPESSTIVRPRVVISDRLKRLAILDAGYTTGLIAQMDPTVQLASGALYAGRELTPKLFNAVTVHCYGDPSGRGWAEEGSGLGDTRVRRRLIRDQVDRISRVPLGELSLVVTYSKDDGGADFVGEIEAELDERCKGWRDQVNGQQRVTIIHWGEHVGANDWRDCQHLFFVGVLRRKWIGDLSGAAYATAREDREAWLRISPAEVEVNQAAQEIMQAIGRGHARATINGQAGRMTVHLPWKEGPGRFVGRGICEGSPMWTELRRMMPGCVINPASAPPKASGADVVEAAVHRALDEVTGDRILTKDLKALVMKHLPGGTATDRVLGLGFKQAAKTNAKRAAAGEPCWVKPDESARSWVRAGALPTSEA